jgi:GDP-4-dehydro-6-deoxy-D-mannose reductase
LSSILVTGAAGFIGRRLVPALEGAGHRVHAVDSRAGDVADAATWARMPAVEVVVHLAGRTFVPDSWAQPEAFIRSNVLGAAEALGFCRTRGARLVFLSSYLYGNPARLPIHEDAPIAATNPYALSKQLAEEACRFYAERLAVPVTVLRPFNVYGPGQGEPFLIPHIVRQLAEGGPIQVKDLEPRRDYVYVDDVVAAIACAVGRRGGFGVFNVGSGVSHSVAQLIDAIQDVWQTRAHVRSAGERRHDEIMDTVADVSAAEAELGWRPRFGLREGLAELRRLTEATRAAAPGGSVR